jgi:hypothetical protein
VDFCLSNDESSLSADAQQGAGDELPPRLSTRSWRAIRTRSSRSGLRFRRQSLSFALIWLPTCQAGSKILFPIFHGFFFLTWRNGLPELAQAA